MGIYNNKLFTETEVLDSVQDPDDPGVDLDQIEKDIMGDGNEAHSEEIEDANSGVIEDPLDEMYIMLCESEYNYNQLIQTIGINELYSATKGKEFVLQEADVRAFWDNIIKIVVGTFKRISEAFMTVVNKLRDSTVLDKKLLAANKKAIIAGADKIKEKKGKANKPVYSYPDLKFDWINFGDNNTWERDFENAIADIANYKPEYYSKEQMKKDQDSFLKKCGASTINNLREILLDKLRGKKVEVLGSSYGANEIIKILSSTKDTQLIREAYNTVKKETNRIIGVINKAKKSTDKKDSEYSHVATICHFFANQIKFEQQVNNSRYLIYLRAAKEKRSQARSVAMQCIAHAPKELVNRKVQHNSASIFGNIDFA